MILDKSLMFCEDQAITSAAASSNYVEVAAVPNLQPGNPVIIHAQVTEDFSTTTGGALTVYVQEDDNTAFSSAATLAQSQAVPAAQLLAGKKIPILTPVNTDKYLRLYFSPATPHSAGKVTGAIVTGQQTNDSNMNAIGDNFL
jgi:TPP-dependent indolepyruvate ferredoxin oxidoreductase alpha subunit